MKKISKWMAMLLTAILLAGAGAWGDLSASAKDAKAQETKVQEQIKVTVPGNKVLTYQYREAQKFVLNLENTGDGALSDIRVTPKLKQQEGKWPFQTEYQSYEAKLEKLDAGEKGTVEFTFTQRDDAGKKRHTLTFTVTADDAEGNEISQEQSFYVNTSAKPEEVKQEQAGAQNQGSETTDNSGLSAGGFSTGEAVYSGGGGEAGSGSIPRVIVTGFTTNPAEVKAGSSFTLTIHLKNTSKKTNVSNMLFELAAPTEGSDEQSSGAAFLPTSGSNSIYLEGIAAGGTADISIQLNAKADLVQKPYAIELSMKYEDSSASQIDSQASVSIPVKQDARFEFSEFEITPEAVQVGSEANVSVNLYNLGRIKLYNSKAIFEGAGINKKEVFLGNLEPGSSTAIDAMLEATEVPEDDTVKMTLTYEDQEGNSYSQEQQFQLLVTEAVDDYVSADADSGMMEEQSSFPVIPLVAALVIIAAVVTGVVIYKRRKNKKMAEEEEGLLDELDGPSEDEQQ